MDLNRDVDLYCIARKSLLAHRLKITGTNVR